MGMFDAGIFGSNSQNSMDNMRQQLEMQMQQYNKMQQAQQVQHGANGLLDDLRKVMGQLGSEEVQYLNTVPEFVNSKVVYESGFMDYLSGKFAAEYINTPVGKQAIENLIDSSKLAVKQIKEASRERVQKLEAMAALLEKDPEVQKKLQEQLANK